MYKGIPRRKNQKTTHWSLSKTNMYITQQYGIYTIGNSSPKKFHGRYLLQTDDVDIEFSKVFTEYI